MGAFTNRTALVTGGSKGIGYHIARHLAREGATIVLVARGAEELERATAEISAEFGVPTSYIAADLSAREGVSTLIDTVRSRDITVDILTNNAGFGIYDVYENIDADAEANMVGVNVAALTRITREFVPGMVARRWGGVINISSILGYAGSPYMSTYGATKAYVLSFTEALWYETRRTGLKVTAVCPGPAETEFFDVAQNRREVMVGGILSVDDVMRTTFDALDRTATPPHVVSGVRNMVLTRLSVLSPRKAVVATIGRINNPGRKR